MPEVTLDYGSVIYADPLFEDDTLNYAGTATYLAGTILGRITASGFLGPYTPGAATGLEKPIAVLAVELSKTGAGQIPCRALIKGVVVQERLVVHGVVGLADFTPAVKDALRSAGVSAVKVADLSVI